MERRRTVDEREAFRAFERRVRAVEDQSSAPQEGVSRVRLRTTSPAKGLRAVRDAYEATVMAVPHYGEEYDETFEQHVHAEFGPELTALLTRGEAFDTQSRRAVLAAASQAQEKRSRLLDALDAEQESFAESAEELRSVIEELSEYESAQFPSLSFGTLDAYRARLVVLEEKCNELVDDRQETLVNQRRNLSLPIEGPDIPTYVYQSLRATYPVVSTAATTVERIDSFRRGVERALSHST